MIEITPSTTVYAILDSYPELEEVLIGMAPAFKKLKNPILRNTVAKVATLKQAASVGGIELTEMISILRRTAGQSELDTIFDKQDYLVKKPSWFYPDKIVGSINESTLEDKNKMPITFVLKKARNMKEGEIFEFVTSFLPAPAIDLIIKKGYESWTYKENDTLYKSYFKKK